MNLNMEITPKALKIIAVVVVLLVALGLAFMNYYLPFLQEAGTLEQEVDSLSLEASILREKINTVQELKNQQLALVETIMALQDEHFTRITQEDIIVLLDVLAGETGVLLGDLGFTDPDLGQGEDSQAISDEFQQYFPEDGAPVYYDLGEEEEEEPAEEEGPATLPLDELLVSTTIEGSYRDCMRFLNTLETLPYDVGLTNYSIIPTQGEDGLPTGVMVNLNLWFYALPDTFRQDNRIIRVEPVDVAPRENPFRPVTGS